MSAIFEDTPLREAILSDSIVVLLLLLAAFVSQKIARDRFWSKNIVTLWRRRRYSLLLIGFFLCVALIDSTLWIGSSENTLDVVSSQEARSLIDRIFSDYKEKTYSAPLASTLFGDTEALKYPARHLLGTNLIGIDVLYITLKGARVALLIGGLTSLIAIPLALFFGMSAGYFGGRIDDMVFFVMSTLASMPGLLLLVALIMALGQSTFSVCIALGVTSWVGFSRLSRGETLKLRELDYVAAARALGVSNRKIITQHILPNLMHLVVITFVLMFSGLVLSEASLSWLGIGVDKSWGQMIAQAKNELSRDPVIWWNVAAAGVALFSLLLAVNRVGDALRDILDPRTNREGST